MKEPRLERRVLNNKGEEIDRLLKNMGNYAIAIQSFCITIIF